MMGPNACSNDLPGIDRIASGSSKCSTDDANIRLENKVVDPKVLAWLGELQLADSGGVSTLAQGDGEESGHFTNAWMFQRYASLDGLRPASLQGDVVQPGPAHPSPSCDEEANNVARFLSNAGNAIIAQVPDDWARAPWAVRWDDLVLSRDLEKRLGTSPTSTLWRASLLTTKESSSSGAERRPVVAKQIYMDRHSKFCDVDIERAMIEIFKITHPNIAEIIGGSFCSNGDFYLISELMDAGSLQDLVINCWAERGSLNRVLGIGMQITNDAVPWITGILSAIEYLHAIPMCHGRITASNVLICPQGRSVKLSDVVINGTLCSGATLFGVGDDALEEFKAQDLFDVGLIAWQIGAGKLIESPWTGRPSCFDGKMSKVFVKLDQVIPTGCKNKCMKRMFQACSGAGGVASATEAMRLIRDGAKVCKPDFVDEVNGSGSSRWYSRSFSRANSSAVAQLQEHVSNVPESAMQPGYFKRAPSGHSQSFGRLVSVIFDGSLTPTLACMEAPAMENINKMGSLSLPRGQSQSHLRRTSAPVLGYVDLPSQRVSGETEPEEVPHVLCEFDGETRGGSMGNLSLRRSTSTPGKPPFSSAASDAKTQMQQQLAPAARFQFRQRSSFLGCRQMTASSELSISMDRNDFSDAFSRARSVASEASGLSLGERCAPRAAKEQLGIEILKASVKSALAGSDGFARKGSLPDSRDIFHPPVSSTEGFMLEGSDSVTSLHEDGPASEHNTGQPLMPLRKKSISVSTGLKSAIKYAFGGRA